MNILLLHAHALMPNSQGVSKVLLTLRDLFRSKGHKVFIVSIYQLNTEYEDPFQYVLPSNEVYCKTNVEFLREIISNNQIEHTINTCGKENELMLISKSCHLCNIRLTTCLHGMILTPVYNIAAVKEYSLRKYHLKLLYYLLNKHWINSVLCKLYILRHRRYYRNVYDYSDSVVLLNDTMEKEYLEMIGITKTDKTLVIPNTLNEISESVEEYKDNIVLWVGKMDTSIKRPDLMLRVWQKVEVHHPDWKLIMLGKGSGSGEAVWREMKELSKQMDLKNVSFEGQVVPKPYYEKAKIVCVTSTHESFSMVLAEALAYGAVPMAFNSFPTASQLIKDGINGLLVPPFNVDKYSEYLGLLMEHEELLQSYKKQRMLSLDAISSENVYNKWISLFQHNHKNKIQ